MEPQEQDKATLISDIEADARREAEGIVKEAEAQAADKRRYARQQVESILNEARLRAREQAEAIRKKATGAAQREVKRRSLRQRAAVVQDVLDRVEQRLAAMIDDASYRGVLGNWIAEATIGLDAGSAEVNASQKERILIDDRLLSDAAEKVRMTTGGQVALALSVSSPLPAQGVVLTAADGRTAFNNQVRTRMSRSHRRIHMLIHDCLFVDEQV